MGGIQFQWKKMENFQWDAVILLLAKTMSSLFFLGGYLYRHHTYLNQAGIFILQKHVHLVQALLYIYEKINTENFLLDT